MIQIPLQFINQHQVNYFRNKTRNSCACGGYGSGKTYVACQKVITLATLYDKYRVAIARQEFKVLKQTTVKTFFKVCPPELYAPPLGRYNEQDGYLRLINGSEILFMHLDDVDEQTLRGLEINSVFVDQAEEIAESINDTLSARIGRWDKVIPGPQLLTPDWPQRFICSRCSISLYLPGNLTHTCQSCGHKLTNLGIYWAPAHYLIAVNPEHETHWIYRRFHPESEEHKEFYTDSHYYEEFPSTDNPALDSETLRVMMSKDPVWVQRFVYGKWGISEATIHRVLPDSIIDPPVEFIENLIRKANLYRILDHGESSPTCCLWVASYKGQYFVYREYYQPNTIISKHRENINALSGDEHYICNYADPSIFYVESQKNGGFWSVADEYLDRTVTTAPPLPWVRADNNEMATRNRINEYLSLDRWVKHPITGEAPAPKLYFIKKSQAHNYGCSFAISETKNQRRKKLGEFNGKPQFSDERQDGVPDHAYDGVRYFVSTHAASPLEPRKTPPENSFLGISNRMKMLKQMKYYDRYGQERALA